MRFRNDEHQYFAVFPTLDPAFDLSRAELVLRRRGDVEEKFSGPEHGWVPQGPEKLERKYVGRYLPIREQEMERLIS